MQDIMFDGIRVVIAAPEESIDVETESMASIILRVGRNGTFLDKNRFGRCQNPFTFDDQPIRKVTA